MKFTKEEISLCKQVAEKHRKSIIKGDWLLWDRIIPKEIVLVHDTFYTEEGNEKTIGILTEQELLGGGEVIPLWTISDCLEFLREKRYKAIRFNEHEGGVGVSVFPENEFELGEGEYGKTPLEACLKVVLAVLEEA